MPNFVKNLIRVLIFSTSLSFLFALHGKIVFYDGTYVLGKVTKVEKNRFFVLPFVDFENIDYVQIVTSK